MEEQTLILTLNYKKMKIIKLTAYSTEVKMYYNVDNIICFAKHGADNFCTIYDVTQDEIRVVETPEQILALINN